jgi:nucleoporin NUP2
VGTGSLGNPVGFGFGAPARTSDKPATSAPSAAGEEAAPAGDDAPPPLLGVSAYDTPGEGEEDEEIVHEVRSKLYQLLKRLVDGAEKSEWADLGVGASTPAAAILDRLLTAAQACSG